MPRFPRLGPKESSGSASFVRNHAKYSEHTGGRPIEFKAVNQEMGSIWTSTAFLEVRSGRRCRFGRYGRFDGIPVQRH